jgi:hypothetical protein
LEERKSAGTENGPKKLAPKNKHKGVAEAIQRSKLGAAADRFICDPVEIQEALEDAVELLRMEFADTEGSGEQTLKKCEAVLRKLKSQNTLILSLYPN